MYEPMSVAHDQSCSPVAGLKPNSLPAMATTSSGLPSGDVATRGVFQDSLMPLARQTSLPVFLSSATRLPLSTLALMMTRSPTSSGELADPHPERSEPTSACHSCLPSWSNANTPVFPKKAYSRSPSADNVLDA